MNILSLSDGLAVAGLAVSVVGLMVTALGFALAVYQLKKTRNASEATKSAIDRFNTRMLYNHLLILLPQVKDLEAELDAAVVSDDKEAATRALVSYSHTATQIAALLEGASSPDDALIGRIRASAKAASTTKAGLVSGSRRALATQMRGVNREVAEIAAECAGLTTIYQASQAKGAT